MSWSYYDNPDRPVRWIQCPDCGVIGWSGKKTWQCNGKARHRVDTDNNLYKTKDDRILERQKHDKRLLDEINLLEKEKEEYLTKHNERRERLQKMRQELRPLYSPKKPEPEKPKETTASIISVQTEVA